MRIEYDPERDLLYIWFGAVGTKAAQTVTVSPGVHGPRRERETDWSGGVRGNRGVVPGADYTTVLETC